MTVNSFNQVFVSRAALRHNYRVIRQQVRAEIPVMAMVKADAYGHGMVEAARCFSEAGCQVFGVAELREAVALRQSDVAGQIFVTIGVAVDGMEQLVAHQLTPVIYDAGTARALSSLAVNKGIHIGVHVKVDTGMGRLGLLPADLAPFLDLLGTLPGLRVDGLMSHFPEADVLDSPSTHAGFTLFATGCVALKERFAGICHIANSGGVLNFPGTHADMVRAGISLYGYNPAGKIASEEENPLQPAMSFVTRVLQVKTMPAGSGISYGHTYTTTHESRIAVLPVGYEDGFSRRFSNLGQVLIGGQPAPVRGRVCMNMCMVDVTDIAGVAAGDEAVVLGRQGERQLTADDLAATMGTISYEVLCLMGNNNQRFYR